MSHDIIGLGGYAMSGKDAVGDVLESMGWKRTFFSKALNQAMMILDPIVGPDQRYFQLVEDVGYVEAKKNLEVRRLLQVFGTEVVRKMFGEDTWVNIVRDEILAANGPIFVTGVRYPNEIKMVKELGGKTWWVHRRGYGPVNNHSSDNTLTYKDFDFVIMNDGTLEDLANVVRKVLSLNE